MLVPSFFIYQFVHVQDYVYIKHNSPQPTIICFRKNMQRNKQVAMGRKKFNMDPKKVGGRNCCDSSEM